MTRKRLTKQATSTRAAAVPFPFVTRPQLAKVFSKDPRTIAKWLEEGLPVARRGRGGRPSLYSLPHCIKWMLARELEGRETSTEHLSATDERALLDRRRREELELKLQVRRGELVEVSAVRAEYADLAVAVKARLRAIPDAIADQIAAAASAGPASAKALLLARIDDALRELARGAAIEDPALEVEADDVEPALEEARA